MSVIINRISISLSCRNTTNKLGGCKMFQDMTIYSCKTSLVSLVVICISVSVYGSVSLSNRVEDVFAECLQSNYQIRSRICMYLLNKLVHVQGASSFIFVHESIYPNISICMFITTDTTLYSAP